MHLALRKNNFLSMYCALKILGFQCMGTQSADISSENVFRNIGYKKLKNVTELNLMRDEMIIFTQD